MPGDSRSLLAELIEAQLDTIELARERELGEDWVRHIAYLQRLYRHAMMALAVIEEHETQDLP
jgi:hypothetical protein